VKQVIFGDLTLRIQLWDTAGQEVYRSITQTYYRDAHCAFVVYDLTDSESFAAVEGWIEDVRRICPPHCQIVLVGNKVDCVNRRDVDAVAVEELVLKEGILSFEASAKTGDNVQTLFKKSIEAVLDRRSVDPKVTGNKGFGLQAADGKKCC
jgi:small GTP-binding protein